MTTNTTKETRCPPPDTSEEFEDVDSSEFGFRIRHKASGIVYRCSIGWDRQSRWFRQEEDSI